MTTALLLTAEDAGRMLGVSRSTVFLLLKRGDLRGLKIGKARRFSRRAIEELVERLEAGEIEIAPLAPYRRSEKADRGR